MAINPTPGQKGTGFTNLQQLMAANMGNRLGQAVGSGIQQTGQQVQQGLQQGQQQFQTQAQAGQLGTQAQRENVQNVLQNVSNVTPEDITNFAKYRSGQYSGPQGIANINTLTGQAEQAQELGKQVGTEGGRQNLLQRYAAGPAQQYTSGQQRLDALLLGTQGAQPLQAARRSVAGLAGQVGSAETAAEQKAQQYGQQARSFGQQVTGQLQKGQAGIYTPAQQAAQQANIAEQQGLTAEQQAAQLAQQGQLSANALQQLGLTAGQRTYGVNVGQFLGYTPQSTQATAINQMTQPQLQQYQNLQRLMGATPVAAPQTPYTAGRATFDQPGLQAALTTAQAPLLKAQSNLQTAQNQYNAALQGHGDPIARAVALQVTKTNLDNAQNQYDLLNQQLSGTVSQIP